MTQIVTSFPHFYRSLIKQMKQAPIVETKRWQSTDANPHALKMHEMSHVSLRYEIPKTLRQLRVEVDPFLPWADDHFENERVSGHPINPGETYKEWRFPASAGQHKLSHFSHSYAERYWPQYAGMTDGGEVNYLEVIEKRIPPNRGIRFDYGCLTDVMSLLFDDPHTRQAYLPIFYPEDITAARKHERIPCTLGYHFLMRDDKLDIMYPMRSCDLTRHFQDDVYLTCRLVKWALGILSESPAWRDVTPGRLYMHISSLHAFTKDLEDA